MLSFKMSILLSLVLASLAASPSFAASLTAGTSRGQQMSAWHSPVDANQRLNPDDVNHGSAW
jgi:hypothetical protein